MGIRVIITGVTGMVGEGVLLECLQNSRVASVLAVTRKRLSLDHPKLTTLVVEDFLKLSENMHQLSGYGACFYCAGVSSNGMTEQDYTRVTFDTTIHFASVVSKLNPALVFCFVSGYHTDSSGTGRVMWARVKGKTENELMKIFPKRSYNFRPALMKPMPGQKQFVGYNFWTHKLLYALFQLILPFCTIQDIAQAMIGATTLGYEKPILEVKDIKLLSQLPSSSYFR